MNTFATDDNNSLSKLHYTPVQRECMKTKPYFLTYVTQEM